MGGWNRSSAGVNTRSLERINQIIFLTVFPWIRVPRWEREPFIKRKNYRHCGSLLIPHPHRVAWARLATVGRHALPSAARDSLRERGRPACESHHTPCRISDWPPHEPNTSANTYDTVQKNFSYPSSGSNTSAHHTTVCLGCAGELLGREQMQMWVPAASVPNSFILLSQRVALLLLSVPTKRYSI
jgi:hypothetical protein